MEKSTKQNMRYSDMELSLFKNTFADNDELLKAIRKVMLQMPLDVIDRDMLTGAFKNHPDVFTVVKKAFLPDLDPKAHFHQMIDLWMTVEFKEKTPEDAWPHFLARKTLVAYLAQQLNVLKTLEYPDSYVIEFTKLGDITGKDMVTAYADLEARNTIIAHTEMQLSSFLILAGNKEDSVDQTKKRLQDSSK